MSTLSPGPVCRKATISISTTLTDGNSLGKVAQYLFELVPYHTASSPVLLNLTACAVAEAGT